MRIRINISALLLLAVTSVFPQIRSVQPPNLQRDLLKTASVLESRGQLELAAEKYLQLATMNPRNISAYLGSKRCLLKTNQYERLENFIRSLQAIRRDIRYEIDLAELQYIRGDTKEAFKHWDTVIAENSKNHQAYSLIGSTFVQYQLYERAIEVYRRGRKNLRDNGLFVFELASLYQRLGEIEKMVMEYIRYLGRNRNQFTFIDSRIAAAEKEDKARSKVEKALKKALKQETIDKNLLNMLLGSHYVRAQEFEKAFKFYTRVTIETNDQKDLRNIGTSMLNFARILLNERQYDLAERVLEMMTKLPNTRITRQAEFALAELYEKQKMYHQAIDSYYKFFEKYPKTTDGLKALLRTGEIQYKLLFDLESAVQTFSTIIQNYNNFQIQIRASLNLADCMIQLDRLDDADQALKRLLAMLGGRKDNFRKAAELERARIKFYQGKISESVALLEEMAMEKLPANNPDEFRNDALEMLFLLKSNAADSSSLALLGRARLLARQRKYMESNTELESVPEGGAFGQLGEEGAFLRADNYQSLGQYQKAIESLLTVYEQKNGLNRDRALLQIGTIYSEKLLDNKMAGQYFEKLLTEFPNSIYVEECREKMRKIVS